MHSTNVLVCFMYIHKNINAFRYIHTLRCMTTIINLYNDFKTQQVRVNNLANCEMCFNYSVHIRI